MSEPVNPYAPPQAVEPLVKFAPGSARPQFVPYRSARGKANVALFLTGLLVVVQALLLASFLMQIALLSSVKSGLAIDPAAATANDGRHIAISVLTVIVALACFVTLLVWIYAAHRNLPALQSHELHFTPGWAVGWFFIPFMNLFKPCQAMFELWNESNPARFMPSGPGMIAAKGGALVGWWWGLRIVSAIAERLMTMGAGAESDLDGLIAVSWVAAGLILLLDIPMLACQFGVVRKIQAFQEERYQLVERIQAATSVPAGGNPFAALA